MQCMRTDSLFWQRVFLVTLVLLNAWESYTLFRQGSFLALLNAAIALLLVVVLVITRPKKRGGV